MPMNHSNVPPTTIQRLPLYVRCLIQAQGERVDVLNSVQIAEMCGTNAAQVRKDLSYLGEYGIRGIGYDVNSLLVHLIRWLGLERPRNAAIVGFGRLGSALQSYGGFQDRGVNIVAVFDADPDKIGLELGGGMTVAPLTDIARITKDLGIEIAILTVPTDVAVGVARAVVDAGIKAILNFAPVGLDVPSDVAVRQADVAAEMQILSFHLNNERDS